MIQYLMKKIIGLAATAVCIGAISSCAVSGNDPFEKNGTLTEKDNVFGKDIPEEELLPKMNINVDETLALSLEKATGENGYVDLLTLTMIHPIHLRACATPSIRGLRAAC